MSRIILHCDMNNFYASVECALDPSLKGKAVAVCGDSEDRHGIVLAKNYEAAKYGIKTAEPVIGAMKKCPSLITVPPHFERYKEFSVRARDIYYRYTDTVESMGLDECWLDISDPRLNESDGVKIANKIRETVKKELGLTISVGVSFNKTFAKLGSDIKKPDAVTLIPKDGYMEMIGGLPASSLIGVGGTTASGLNTYGVETIAELARFSESMMTRIFCKLGTHIWKCANGLDDSPVIGKENEAADKSIGNGITARNDLKTGEEVWQMMLELSEEIGLRLTDSEKKASAVAIQIKDNEFNVKQWQTPLEIPTQSAFSVAKAAFELFNTHYRWSKPVRAVTIRVINLIDLKKPSQMNMFSEKRVKTNVKNEKIDHTLEELRGKYGSGVIKNASVKVNKR